MTIFVVHEHHARHLHWDLRIEREGVLKSWAVPKGLPLRKGIKRLAIRVADHPLEYAQFEGTIPEGQYGAGEVKIWDSGQCRIQKWDEKKIEVKFVGQKLRGRYVLIRMRGDQWLIFKL